MLKFIMHFDPWLKYQFIHPVLKMLILILIQSCFDQGLKIPIWCWFWVFLIFNTNKLGWPKGNNLKVKNRSTQIFSQENFHK